MGTRQQDDLHMQTKLKKEMQSKSNRETREGEKWMGHKKGVITAVRAEECGEERRGPKSRKGRPREGTTRKTKGWCVGYHEALKGPESIERHRAKRT